MAKKNLSFDNAVLKLEKDGEIIAEGKADVNVKEKTITFESSFVPLYPIGTDMEVVRILENKEVHRFWGKVYLSDKSLMRLVSLDDELLPGSDRIYCNDMNFIAKASTSFSVEINKKGLFKQRVVEKQVKKDFDIKVISITKDGICFSLEDPDENEKSSSNIDYLEKKSYLYEFPIEVGQEFVVTAKTALPFENVRVEVVNIISNGLCPCFECKFSFLSDDEEKKVDDFLWQYNIIFNKLFT